MNGYLNPVLDCAYDAFLQKYIRLFNPALVLIRDVGFLEYRFGLIRVEWPEQASLLIHFHDQTCVT
jgi:hypothetical protein